MFTQQLAEAACHGITTKDLHSREMSGDFARVGQKKGLVDTTGMGRLGERPGCQQGRRKNPSTDFL